jgi:type II secretory pathway predicted ATPase ExeA
MDLRFFHLKRYPFIDSPEALFFFMSISHRKALDAILHGVETRQGIVMVLGEQGMGKTTLLQTAARILTQQGQKVLSWLKPPVFFPMLLQTLLHDLGAEAVPETVPELRTRLEHIVLADRLAGRSVVLLIDNAHYLPLETLEQFLLLNEQELPAGKGPLLQVVLFGKPALAKALQTSECQHLQRDITVLAPLTKKESRAYIEQRLAKVATRHTPLFTTWALRRIVKVARGEPQLLNILCTDALQAGVQYQRKPIPLRLARLVTPEYRNLKLALFVRWGLVSVASLAIFAWLLQGVDTPSPRSVTVTDMARAPLSQPAPAAVKSPPAVPAPFHPEPALPYLPMLPASRAPDVPEDKASAEPLTHSTATPSQTPAAVSPEPAESQQAPPVSSAPESPQAPLPQESQDANSTGVPRVVCVRSQPGGYQGKEIVLVDYDKPAVRRLVADGALNLAPLLSPDGTLLAYTSYRRGLPILYLRHLRTGEDTRVSSESGIALAGSWSPDMRYLAFSQSVAGNSDIYLYDVRQARVQRLTSHAGIDISPSFAPDSQRLVFASNRDGSLQIYRTDMQGSAPVRLTHGGEFNTAPAWSPRHDTIAYLGRSDDRGLDLYTIHADGSNRQRLTSQGISEDSPTWAPDGRVLMYSSVRGGVRQLRLIRVESREEHALADNRIFCQSPQWITSSTP